MKNQKNPKKGDRFGKLTLLNFKRHNKRVVCVCKCDCGKVTNVKISRINKIKKCIICSAKENGRARLLPAEQLGFNLLFNTYKSNAKKKELLFNIDEENFKKLISDKCFYCGKEPNTKLNKVKNREFYYNGIDRQNNSLGYENYNVVTCCKDCNYKKSNQNSEEFIKWIKTVYENLKLGI